MHLPAPSPAADTRLTRSTGLTRTGTQPSARAAFLRDITLEAGFDPATGEGMLTARIQVGGLFAAGLTVVIRIDGRDRVEARADESLAFLRVAAGKVTPWSAELPTLHPVTVELVDEEHTIVDSVLLAVGYRRIEPVAGGLIVNGTPVVVSGIAPRNEGLGAQSTWPGEVDSILTRLAHLKQFNINAIRVAPEAIDHVFLRCADQIGIYLIDGTDEESERLAATFASDPRHPEVVEGSIHPAMYELRRRFSPIELASTADELAEGILRLRNEQYFASLDGFTVTAHVVTSCGVDDGVPLAVAASPGETVSVSVPDTLRYHLGGPTVLGLRLIVRTAVDSIWATAATEIAGLQLTLRENTEPGRHAAPGRRIFLGDDGVLEHPYLAVGPRICLWRAGTDSSSLAGLSRRVDSIEWSDEEATVRVVATHTTAAGHRITHAQRIRRLIDGRLHFEESVLIPAGLDEIPRVGITMETRPGFDSVEWIGDGPHETHPGRRDSALHGQWSSSVGGMSVPYVRPRESGGHANVTWADLSDGIESLSLFFDRGMQFSVSHFRGDDLERADDWAELEPRENTIVHLDVAYAEEQSPFSVAPCPGVGTGTHAWSWTLHAREDY